MASKNKRLNVAAGIFQQSLEGTIRKISLSDIIPSREQPRQNKDINIKSLSKSLQEEGLLQPIVVTKKGEKYLIVAGERRFRAAKLAKWAEIECRILNKDEKDTYRLAVIENLQRENLDAFEEAIAYKKLKEQFEHTDQELSTIIGKSRNYISEIISIAEIPTQWRTKAFEAGISSKNMLVQYAMALKTENGKEFLSEFESGNISTVKSAKEFNKSKKSISSHKTPGESNKPDKETITIRPKVEIKAKEGKGGLFSINLSVTGLDANQEKIQKITQDLRTYTSGLLKK